MDGDLTQDQIALVLRRAAEIDREFAVGPVGGLDAVAVEQAAVEAGLSLPAVRRALTEFRAGMLHDEGPPRRRLLGAPDLTVSRIVPGPAAAAEAELHRFLSGELFALRRDLGHRTLWVRRPGLGVQVLRTVDRAVQRRLILREVQQVEVSVVDEPGPDEQWVLVRLDVDVVSIRRAQGRVAGSAAVVGGSVAAASVAVAGLHPVLLATVGAGAGLAAAGHWAGCALYRKRVGEIESALAGVLDRMERTARRELRGWRG